MEASPFIDVFGWARNDKKYLWYTHEGRCIQNIKINQGVLRGGCRRDELEKMGVVLGSKWLEMDGKIITSSCPRTAPDVAYELLEQLTSTGMMLQVKAAMGY